MKKAVAKNVLKQVKSHYDQIAAEWDETRQRAWFEFEIYQELCFKGAKVLDLGCGNGRLYWQALKDRDVRYLGVDISKELLKKAAEPKQELTRKQKYRVQFKPGSLTKVPAKAKKFDLTYCIAAFHHLPTVEMRKKSLLEMQRVLKDDGYIVISVWNLWQKKYRKYIWQAIWRFLKTFGKYSWNDTFFAWKKQKNKQKFQRYYHAFTPWEMRVLLRESGLKIVQELFVDNKSVDASLFTAHNFVWICQK